MAHSFWRFSIWTHWRRYVFVLVLGSLVGHIMLNRTPSPPYQQQQAPVYDDDDISNRENGKQQSKNTVDSFESFNSTLQSGPTFNIFTGETLEDDRLKTENADVKTATYEAVKPVELGAQLNSNTSREEQVFKDKPVELQDEGRQSDSNQEVKDAGEETTWQEREVEYLRRNERIRQVCQKRNVQITNPPVIKYHNVTSIKSTPGIDEGNTSLNTIK